MAAILGKKLGMTQVFQDDGTVIPVTVIEAGPCKVTAVRNSERDGYAAVQLAFGEVKQGKLSRAEEGHLKRASAAAAPPPGRVPRRGSRRARRARARRSATTSPSRASSRPEGQGRRDLDRQGLPGRDQAPQLQPRPGLHGSHNVRAPGSIGASAFPARVFKGMRMPGQMGNKRRTQKGLEVASIDAERNLLLIKGSVPGSKNSIVEVRTDA